MAAGVIDPAVDGARAELAAAGSPSVALLARAAELEPFVLEAAPQRGAAVLSREFRRVELQLTLRIGSAADAAAERSLAQRAPDNSVS